MNLPNQKRDARSIIQGGLLFILIWLAYFPSLRGDFLWDDDDNVTNNLALRSLNGLGQIWFKPGVTQQYYPLTHTSFWIDYQLWGLHPLPYHVVNILCHAAGVILLWQILRRLRVPGAWLGAALFAVHPVGVESVAWITERKNALSGVFFLGALLMSLKFWLPRQPSNPEAANMDSASDANVRCGPWKFYWLTLGLYLCALLSKTATIGLPAVILFLIWWQRRKVVWRDACLLLPFLALGAGLGLVTSWLEKNNGGATGSQWDFSLLQRCLIAGRVFWFYPMKLLWPHPLMFMYPRWIIRTSQPLAWLPILAAATGLLVLWWKRNGWGRPALFTAGYFIAMIFPVMGFFNVYFFRYSFVCDHFQYLASIAPLALAGAGVTLALERFPKPVKLLAPTMLLLLLGLLAARQTSVYLSRETLWRDSLKHNPDSWIANNNLGGELAARGDLTGAVALYHQALQIDPHSDLTLYNLSIESSRAGNPDEAIDYCRRALEIRPGSFDANLYLGNLLDAKGDFTGAAQHYVEAGLANTNSYTAYLNLGVDLIRLGKIIEAAGVCRQAVRIAPNSADAHKNLGIALARQGKTDDAFGELQQSLKIDPTSADTHYYLGRVLMIQGQKNAARDQFVESLRLKPGYAEAQHQLDALDPAGNAVIQVK